MKTSNIVAIVQQTIKSLRFASEPYQIDILLQNSAGDPVVNANQEELTQILNNLLTNAVHFSNPGQKIWVNIQRVHQSIRVCIKDTGPAIPKKFRDEIFQRPSDSDMDDGPLKGRSGTGLWISKALIDKYDGQISYETSDKNESIFYFDIPECISQIRKESGKLLYKVNCRALICEDEYDIAVLISTMLSEMGFETSIALTAEHAKQELASRNYDVMMLDLALPDQDGVSFAQELRSQKKTESLPIVVISAKMGLARIKTLKENLRIDSWLTKPVNSQQLSEALRAFAY